MKKLTYQTNKKLPKCWVIETDDNDPQILDNIQQAYSQAGLKTDFEVVYDQDWNFPYTAVFWYGKKTKEVQKYIEDTKLEYKEMWS